MNYLVPKNINLFWNFGFLLAILFVLQALSGTLLVFIYSPVKISIFAEVTKISFEFNVGWLLRFYHSLGVSAYFTVMFIHAVKGIWFSSKIIPWSWLSGLFLLGASVAVAFFGYMLPNGQMSFWGATVIANLLGILGDAKVLTFGGYVVDEATLKKFYMYHCLVPIIIFFVMLAHMYYLHRNSSTNPLPIAEAMEALRFFPTEMFSDVRFLFILFMFVVSQVNFGSVETFQADPDNSIEANSMVTPSHIVPEWYLLLFYATLKVFPAKMAGLLAIVVVIEVLIILGESRFFTTILSVLCFYRSFTLASVTFIPLLLILSFIGKMVITIVLAIIGIAVLNNILSFVERIVDSARIRVMFE